MILRWIYHIWRYLWVTVLIVVTFLLVLMGIGWALLQVDGFQRYLANQAENRFSEQFEGKLVIGELGGQLPFNVRAKDVLLIHTDSDGEPADTVAVIRELEAQLGFRDLLRGDITLTSVLIDDPVVNLRTDENGEYTFSKALKRKKAEADTVSVPDAPTQFPELRVSEFRINNGKLNAETVNTESADFKLPEPFMAGNINLSMSLELDNYSQFLNIYGLTASTPDLKVSDWMFRGQLYADERYLEFNRITLRTPESQVRVSLEIDGVNIRNGGLKDQFLDAAYHLRVRDTHVLSDEFTDLFPALTAYGQPVELELETRGNLEALNLKRLDVLFGESRLMANGRAEYLDDSENLAYESEIEFFKFTQADMDKLKLDVNELGFKDWEKLTIRANMNGGAKYHEGRIEIEPPHGKVVAEGRVDIGDEILYDIKANIDDLRLSDFPSIKKTNSGFNGELTFSGIGIDPKTMNARLQASLKNSRYEQVILTEAEMDIMFEDGFIEPEFQIMTPDGMLAVTGWVDLLSDDIVVRLEGAADDFDLAAFIEHEEVAQSNLNFRFNLQTTGNHPDDLTGSFYLDLRESVFGEHELGEHEFLVALRELENGKHSLLLRSSILEAELAGSIKPTQILSNLDYWKDEIDKIIQERSVYDEFKLSERRLTVEDSKPELRDMELMLTARVDDLTLLHKLIPGFPEMDMLTNVDFLLKTSSNSISLKGEVLSDFIEIDDIAADSLSLKFDLELHNDKPTDFFKTGFNLQAAEIGIAGTKFRDTDLLIDGYDEAFVLQRFKSFVGDNVEIGLMLSTVFSTYDVDIRVMDFYVGDDSYNWTNISHSPIIIDRGGRVHVDNLEFGNLDERIIIDGVFSESTEDSVAYLFSNFQLDRISDMVNAEIGFSGIMNGVFKTSTLTTSASFIGDMSITEFKLDDRTIGDIRFNSRYNRDEERFDTSLRILTDPEVYENYLAGNEDVGQDINIEGYFTTNFGADETWAAFDVDFSEIDLWILPYFVEGVFNSVEGRASGEGSIAFAGNDFTYDARFRVHDVKIRPAFLNPELTLNGRVDLNTNEGVVFRNVDIRDNHNGRGRFYGFVNIDHNRDRNPLDISLEMNRLMFLDNSFDEDTPFYGRAWASGLVNLRGDDTERLFISTPDGPLRLTSNSIVSIPTEDDGYVDERARFIEFVDDFDEPVAADDRDGNGNDNRNNEDRTFMEQFQLDLQFVAEEDMVVRLVFDHVTQEILTARGTGRIRLTLQDEVFQVFGRFDVRSGDYNFVGGDIFTKRLTIRDEGQINWDGDPVNARINVTAAYRARPDISVLRPEFGDSQPVRVPVDLILHITGTLESIENDFYFEFPSGVDAGQSAALLAEINSEEQKLLQATSLLFTGNFIPVATASGERDPFFQGRAGQIGLGTLLSSQINNLLNSNLSNLDVDLNMTGFDQADLGIALRLFDDRLTLRREGVVTGPDANLGDFDVTYQINRYLSVEVFHRRDPLLPGLFNVGQGQFESVNGVGLEARIQFNTWGEFGNRVFSPVRSLFVSDRKKEEDDDEDSSVAATD